MTYYRIYCFGADGRIQDFAEAHCASDADVVAQARPFMSRFRRVEVWDRDRMVQRLEGSLATGQAAPGGAGPGDTATVLPKRRIGTMMPRIGVLLRGGHAFS